jgi:DNA replication protein DnaC
LHDLLAVRWDFQLPRALRQLEHFDFLPIDDLGYLPQRAERYARRAMEITSDLVCSQWDQVFQNLMATAAAIDRVLHHSHHPGVRCALLLDWRSQRPSTGPGQ